jgi:hypothetical protein
MFAMLGGGALWFAQPLLSGRSEVVGAGTFAIYLVLVVVGVCLAVLAGAPDRGRGRALAAGLAGIGAVWLAAESFVVHQIMALHGRVRASELHTGWIDTAQEFAEATAQSSVVVAGAWAALAAALLLLTGVRRWTPTVYPPRVWVTLLVLVLSVAGLRSEAHKGLDRLASQVVPGKLGAAVFWNLGFVMEDVPAAERPAWAAGRIRVDAIPTGLGFADGDFLVAIEDRTGDVITLLEELQSCACGAEGAAVDPSCQLVQDCLRPGSQLEFTLSRAPDGRIERVKVPLQHIGADQK